MSENTTLSCRRHLTEMDTVTFWRCWVDAGERHYWGRVDIWLDMYIYIYYYFFKFSFMFFSKRYFHFKMSCGRTFPPTTVWYTAIMHSPLKCSSTAHLRVNECRVVPQQDTLELYSYDCVIYGGVHAAVTLSTSVCLTLHFAVPTNHYDVG